LAPNSRFCILHSKFVHKANPPAKDLDDPPARDIGGGGGLVLDGVADDVYLALVAQTLEVPAGCDALVVARGKYLCYPASVVVFNMENKKDTR